MRAIVARVLIVVLITLCAGSATDSNTAAGRSPSVAQLMLALRGKAKILESSTGMQRGYQSFVAEQKLPPATVRYSEYVMARLLYEATRDAGLWNLHWTITNREPESDNIWRQWQHAQPSPALPTADAECDELSALHAFLMRRAGIRGVGLFWPYSNHTVAVWELRPLNSRRLHVVVPTTQIFLAENDFFGTHKFDPWRQKTIHEYTRRDVPDSFRLPQPLLDFFLRQVDRYAGASNTTLQQLRYLREGVFQKAWTPEDAARVALRIRESIKSGPIEDPAALWNFAEDMRSQPMH